MEIELLNIDTRETIIIRPDENGVLRIPAGAWAPVGPLAIPVGQVLAGAEPTTINDPALRLMLRIMALAKATGCTTEQAAWAIVLVDERDLFTKHPFPG